MLIDTHKAVKRLEEAGVSSDQAEAFVEVVTRADERVATSEDLQQQGMELRNEIQQQGMELRNEIRQQGTELRSEISNVRAEMEAMEMRMTRKIYAVGFVVIGVLSALNLLT